MINRASQSLTCIKQICSAARLFDTQRMLVCVAVISLASCGCINPMTTRLPSFYASNPQLENLEFQQQDPYPDPNIAPDGGSRPPDFQRPRTPSRQAAEQRLFQGLRQLPQSVPRGAPLTGQRHSSSVL
ncbi:MAG: hypothetical protein ABJZ55_05810 [Fuerstiella sp.]